MFEKIVMFFRAPKINVSGFADVPLTSRLRYADTPADTPADALFSRRATRRLFLWGGYVYIPLGKRPLRMRLKRLL